MLMDTKNNKNENSKKLEIIFWNNLRNGDMEALGALYDMYVDQLFSIGMRKDGKKDYVMDCIHDMFYDLYKYRSKLSKTDSVEYYLIRSFTRKLNRQYNHKDRYGEMDPNSFRKSLGKKYTESFEEDFIREEQIQERSNKLQQAMDTLTKKQKKGLYLRFQQGRSYEEIAAIMDVSIESARTTVYRALKTLRKHPFTLGVFIKIIFF